MNKMIMLLSVACALAVTPAFSAVTADYEENEKSSDLITPEVSAAAEMMFGDKMAEQILHAVRLQMVKYDRDMMSRAGREAWHGKLICQEIHTNELCKILVYSNETDGVIWRYRMPFKPTTVAESNAKLTLTVMTNGVPARLAKARVRRTAEKSATSNVTVTVTSCSN